VPEEFTQLTLSTNIALNRQQLRAFALAPSRDAQRLAILALKDRDPSVRFHGATTLGRLKDDPSRAIRPLLNALPEKDHFTRFAIEKALNRLALQDPKSWALIVPGLTNQDAEIRASITHALRDTYETQLVTELQRLIRRSDAPGFSREAAISLLAPIIRALPEWKGEWWAYHPALAPTPIKTVAWEITESSLALFKNLLRDEPELRLSTIRALAHAQEISLAPTLRDLYADDASSKIRKEIIQTLTVFKDTNSTAVVLAALNSSDRNVVHLSLGLARFSHSPEVLASISQIIERTDSAPELRLEAINTSGHLRNTHALAAITKAAKSDEPKLRSAAISALGKIGGTLAAKTLLSLFELPEPALHLEAANALAEIKDFSSLAPELQNVKADLVIKRLLSLYTEKPTREAALEALLRMPDATAIPAYIDALGNANPTTRERSSKVIHTFAAQALPMVRSRIRTLPPVVLAEIAKLYPLENDLTLIAREKTVPTLDDYIQAALDNQGDTHRGRRIFHDQTGVSCIKCHTVAGEGNAVGPDMTAIGAQFPRDALIEHIINPSKSVREGYQQVLIETADDENYAGLIKSETADTLTVLTAEAKLQIIPKSKITSRQSSQLSLMPDGLHLGLSLEEFADLIAYLESLKGSPAQKGK
jgi:putative heme-binding domain-containing protein